MTPEQFRQVEELFFEARDLPAERRVARLSACPDAEVRGEVEKLLSHQREGESLERLHVELVSGASGETSGLIGQRCGPYHIESLAARGGMGVVYAARDTRLGRRVAIKVLPAAFHQDAGRRARLLREAKLLASLNHPNIATIYGLEECDGNELLVMEFVEGETLAGRIARGALQVPEALSAAAQIAAALSAAHDASVVHRDLKPANVMITPEGVVKVLDFGLARENVSALTLSKAPTLLASGGPMTRDGAVLGTPGYMSPEQARGLPTDRRTDVFSFGCVLYECLTGVPAFSGPTALDAMTAAIEREPDMTPLPARTPPTVRRVLARCLAKDPAQRLRDLGDVRAELEETLRLREWSATGSFQQAVAAPGRAWRHRWTAAVVLLTTAALLAGVWAGRATRGPAVAAEVRRFDLSLPEDVPQRDLERVQLALSRDGKMIVFAGATAEGQALWLRSHADGLWRKLDQTAGAHRPFLSPDGQWVGYYRDRHLLKRRLSSGGDPIHVATVTNWYGASWDDAGVLHFASAWGDPVLAVAGADAAPRRVSRLAPEKGEASHVSPLCVPRGRHVLYNVWSGGEECAIHAADAAGTTHLVMANASTPRVGPTPSGDFLLFERASIIFAAPFDRATARVTGPEVAVAEGVLNDVTRFAAYFDVADDGTLVYIPGAGFTEESRLAFINQDGTTTPVNADRLSFSEPCFSADGSKMAVAVKGKLYRTLVYDLARQTREYLLTGGDTLSQALSPDGATLACTVNRGGGYGIDLINLADGRRTRRVQPGPDYQSDLIWSRDGKFLVFTMSPREGAPRDVWWVPVAEDGGPPRVLVATTASDIKAVISPDCKWVAYASDVSGQEQIYLVAHPDGDRTRQISFSGGSTPTWAPDGKTLYYQAAGNLLSVAVSPDGQPSGQPTVVYDKPFGQSDPLGRNYTVDPSGRIVIVEPSERRPKISHMHVIVPWHALLPANR